MIDLTEEDFIRLHTFIKAHYGIDLSKKKLLISSRLSNELMQMGFKSFHDFVNAIISKRHPDLTVTMINKLTTNYTYFFREQEHFDYMMLEVLPKLRALHQRDHVISIWSAGCSSGEEPYTISMCLKEFFGKEAAAWDLRVLATDISQNILDSARNPVYTEEQLSKIPPHWIKYFQPIPGGGYTIAPVIKDNVIFKTFNLMDEPHWKRPFDLIFCRNVMIYFDQPTKDKLVDRLYNVTSPGGHLFIGHSESLPKSSCPYEYVMPAIYKKRE